ncbi:MAG TPA: PRC-barrel domain-containing protein [Cytophagaceae bacterium]|jgi:sporulation protein YlmC with PRC-barrel domain|nr:PRC-barrel domain-containing protein [Cytophagaceae bacterium]
MNPIDLEKENKTGKNSDGVNANWPVKMLTASSIIGDHVENRNGEKLGKIKDVMVNMKRGFIEYVVIEFGGFLGLGEKLFAVPFEALELKADRQTFLLDRQKDFLKNAPGFNKEHWPGTNSHHYTEVDSYWGNFMGPSVGASM